MKLYFMFKNKFLHLHTAHISLTNIDLSVCRHWAKYVAIYMNVSTFKNGVWCALRSSPSVSTFRMLCRHLIKFVDILNCLAWGKSAELVCPYCPLYVNISQLMSLFDGTHLSHSLQPYHLLPPLHPLPPPRDLPLPPPLPPLPHLHLRTDLLVPVGIRRAWSLSSW